MWQDPHCLIDRFILAPDNNGWREQRRLDHEHWKSWINLDALNSASDNELRSYFLEYFDKGAGRQTLIKLNRDKIIRDVGRFRSSLRFLFDESTSVQKRLDDVLEKSGKHHIEGMGRGLATSFLTDFDLAQYATWNATTESGLTAIGRMPQFSRADTAGLRYAKVLAELKATRELRPAVTFLDVDHLFKRPGYSVRGVVIVQAEDERLRYALTQIPAVSAFTYTISFDLKKISVASVAAVA